MYDTDTTAEQDQRERSVDAWMRAAAYAAGTEPDDEHVVATQPAVEPVELGDQVEVKEWDNLVLGQALVGVGSDG